MCGVLCSAAAQLRSLMDHVVGARFAPPPVLYGAFEPNEGREYRRRAAMRNCLARVFVDVAQGGSVRCGAPVSSDCVQPGS